MDSENGRSPRTQQGPQRGSRIWLACSRCQKRKIKCDGKSPCSSCQKAGSVCSSGNTTRDRGYSKAYVSSLLDRIRWLESIVEAASPGFDLSQATPLAPEIHKNTARQLEQPDGPNQHEEPTNSFEDVAVIHSDSRPAAARAADAPPERVHDIGLVSVGAGQDLRYVGPSSGYGFAKLLLKVTGVSSTRQTAGRREKGVGPSEALVAVRALEITAASLPATLDLSAKLSSVYWETIHPQYPFLHQPTHLKRLEHVYNSQNPKPIYKFQVFMVLAISSTILSHRFKTVHSAQGFAAAALQTIDHMQFDGSLEGLQCLLLLIVYALVNPSTGLNAWYLNYQAVASVLDLGLQRDVKSNLSLLTKEMRTRIFWVVYSLDRTLATALGRPIGIRDEGCDLRLPLDIELDIDDGQLLSQDPKPRQPNMPPTSISNSIHLMKLATLISEIKYLTQSVNTKTPSHCYPGVPDILAWQAEMQGRLDSWASEVSQNCPSNYLTQVATLKHHEARILLLRPSPAINSPSPAALRTCHVSASAVIRVTLDIYRNDELVYSWTTVHALLVASITMLYCICVVPDLSQEAAASVDLLQTQLQGVSNVLSAAAEMWPDTKRSRDVVVDVSTATIQWLCRRTGGRQGRGSRTFNTAVSAQAVPLNPVNSISTDTPRSLLDPSQDATMDCDGSSMVDSFLSMFDGVNMSPGLMDMDVNSIMQGIFSDSQPIVDFDFDFDTGLHMD